MISTSVFTIKSFNPSPKSPVFLLSGDIDSSIKSMGVSGGKHSSIFFTDKQWNIIVLLNSGLNIIKIIASVNNSVDINTPNVSGNIIKTIEVMLPETNITPFNNYNTFDDHGALLGLERNIGEKNLRYKKRLLDHLKFRGGVTYFGLIEAIPRELSLQNIHEGAHIKLALNSKGLPVIERLIYESRFNEIVLHAAEFKHSQSNRIDPATLDVELETEPGLEPQILIISEGGTQIKDGWKLFRTDRTNFIRFDEEFGGLDIFITYSETLKISKLNKTVSQLISEINALTLSGQPFVFIDIIDQNILTLDARTLYQLPPTLIPNLPTPIPNTNNPDNFLKLNFSEVLLLSLFRQRKNLLGNRGTGLQGDGELFKYVPTIRSYSRLEWGQTLIGGNRLKQFDTFGTNEIQQDLSFLPHLTDPIRGYWNDNGFKSDIHRHIVKGLKDFKGPKPESWQSGVGGRDDLKGQIVSRRFESLENTIRSIIRGVNTSGSGGPSGVNPGDLNPTLSGLDTNQGYGIKYGISYGFL